METYRGVIRSPADAIKLFEACRLGTLPRVQRRLSEKERQSITSGSVFVWDEREAGMRRWTDGKSWSASRVSGSFLTYREMEGKRGGGNFVPAPRRLGGKTPDSGRGSDEDADMDAEGPDGYRYKPDGLMKQSFSITTSTGQHLHLISYYARPHSNMAELPQPTTDPSLRHIIPVKGMYPESTVHDQTPAPSRGPAPPQPQGPYMSQPPHMMPGPPPPGSRAPYPYPQNYNWPPSPMSTPPYNYANGLHHLPPPPQPGQMIPYHYSVMSQHQPHTLQQPPPPYDTRPQQQQHDQSRRELQTSAPQPQASIPSYAASNAQRDAQQARLMAEQAQQAQRLHQNQSMSANCQPAPVDPRLLGPSTTAAQMQQQQQQQAQTILQQVAAQNGHSPRQQQQQQVPSPSLRNGNSNGNSPRSQGQNQPPLSQSQSQSIPSISNMVHGATANGSTSSPSSPGHASQPAPQHGPAPTSAPQNPTPTSAPGDLKHTTNGTNGVNGVNTTTNGSAGSRNGSASPQSRNGEDNTEGGGRPQDIPHAKLGPQFGGEDMRALRVLDRKFCI